MSGLPGATEVNSRPRKRPNTWAFRHRSGGKETVRVRRVGGRGGFELSVPVRVEIGSDEARVSSVDPRTFGANSLTSRVLLGVSLGMREGFETPLERVVRPERIWRGFLSGAQTEKGELSPYALAKSAVAVSQLCYPPSCGEGRNGRRLALAR